MSIPSLLTHPATPPRRCSLHSSYLFSNLVWHRPMAGDSAVNPQSSERSTDGLGSVKEDAIDGNPSRMPARSALGRLVQALRRWLARMNLIPQSLDPSIPIVALGPGGDFTKAWPEIQPQRHEEAKER